MSEAKSSLSSRDAKVVWHPFTQHQTAATPLAVRSAKGAELVLDDGRVVIDAISSWWTSLHGHGHPEIVAAIAEQAKTLDHVIYAGCTHEPAVEVAEGLISVTGLTGGRVFFSDNGSTAVEVALKACIQHWQNVGQSERCEFITLQDAYHGDTVGAMSAGDPGDFGRPFKKLLFPTHRVDLPTLHDPPEQSARKRALIAEKIVELGPRLAAVIFEPMVQGAGGMRMTTPETLTWLVRAVRAAGGWVIADEVMTGFGRTGRLFAWQHQSEAPDVICCAKGLTGGTLPLSATVFRKGIFEAFLGPNKETAFLHGHSFTANPIACAAACASLQIIQRPDFAQQLARVEALTKAQIERLRSHRSVKRTRQAGTIGVIELVGGAGYFAAQQADLGAVAISHGVLLRPLGALLYTMPPLAVTEEQIEHIYLAVEACLDEWAALQL
ncbi:MAG TPA: adenosylmethionine--8-amino-7-oxononanoate transaminase [Myxococcales bacterium]|nr:adenosylmethionine--8-amino-7-oxononanoate transaminase [Myxococcales bacterium]